jgi:hypothetical protein
MPHSFLCTCRNTKIVKQEHINGTVSIWCNNCIKSERSICSCGHTANAHKDERTNTLGECFWSYNCDCKEWDPK